MHVRITQPAKRRRSGAISNWTFELDAYEVVGQDAQPFLRDGRSERIAQERITTARIFGAGRGGRVQRESELGN